MKYFERLHDGHPSYDPLTPEDFERCRDAYVDFLNRYFEHEGKDIRAIGLDNIYESSLHLFSKEDYDKLTEKQKANMVGFDKATNWPEVDGKPVLNIPYEPEDDGDLQSLLDTASPDDAIRIITIIDKPRFNDVLQRVDAFYSHLSKGICKGCRLEGLVYQFGLCRECVSIAVCEVCGDPIDRLPENGSNLCKGCYNADI